MAVKSSLVVVLGASLLSGVGSASAQTGSEWLRVFLGEVESLSASFTQNVFDESMNVLEESSGHMYLRRPARFRWVYERPYSQEIVGDGERVWIHDADLEQVIVSAMDPTLGDSPALLLSTDRPVEESFEVRDLPGEGEVAWVELVPHAPEATFNAVRLGFSSDAGDLRMMELVDGFGQLTQIEFDDLRLNPRLDDDLFSYEPPPGVDVIER